MGLFQRPKRGVVSPEVIRLLPTYGEAVLSARRAGRPVADPRFDWGAFAGPVHMELMSGDRDAVITELYDAAMNAPDRELATVGTYRVLAEFNENLDDQRFLELYDASLEHMRACGLSSGQLTGHEKRRWGATHDEGPSSFDRVVEVAGVHW
jgi:hypothetical protein